MHAFSQESIKTINCSAKFTEQTHIDYWHTITLEVIAFELIKIEIRIDSLTGLTVISTKM